MPLHKDSNILIVEDEFINSLFVKQILNNLNYNAIYTTTTSNDAFEISKKRRIELIFMDINIDGAVDGIMCAELLNTLYKIPIIFMTAYSDKQTIEDANHTNIYGFIVKPFDENDIIKELDKASKKLNLQKKEYKKEQNLKLSEKSTYSLITKKLSIENNNITLTKKESDLLYIFCLNRNNFLSYEVLKKYIWENKNIANSTIRDTILRLRNKAPCLKITNIKNVGYSLHYD